MRPPGHVDNGSDEGTVEMQPLNPHSMRSSTSSSIRRGGDSSFVGRRPLSQLGGNSGSSGRLSSTRDEDGYEGGDENNHTPLPLPPPLDVGDDDPLRSGIGIDETFKGNASGDDEDVETPFVVPPPEDDGLGDGIGDADTVIEYPTQHVSGTTDLERRSLRRKKVSIPRAVSEVANGVIDLRHETEEELLEDLELYTEEFSRWNVNTPSRRNRLELARRGLIEAANCVRNVHEEVWTRKVSEKYNKALMEVQRIVQGQEALLEQSIFTVALQGIDDDSLRTKFLRKTFFRHEINLRECTRIAAGWACLFVVCYAPWFVVLVISYRGRSFCTKGEASYIYIFMFFLGVNFVLNCGAACIAVFDRGVLCTDRARTKRWINRVIGLYTATFIAFNVYGLTLLWVPSGRESNCSLQPETLAIIVAFLVLPCICFGLQAIFHVGDTRRKRDHPSKQAAGQVV